MSYSHSGTQPDPSRVSVSKSDSTSSTHEQTTFNTPMIEALIQAAESRGYRIRWHRGGPKAAWVPAQNAITVQIGMDDVTTLCSLAHELGHAHYGDPPGHHGAHEIRADRFAARLLINPTEYATAEAIYGPHPAAIAAELGVTVNILKSWQQLYTALMVKSS